MKKILLIPIMATLFYACNTNKLKVPKQSKKQITEQSQVSVTDTKGYKLMQQKCFICHLEKPNPELRDKMLAPPMSRVKEHYKFSDKKEFVDAIVSFVSNPTTDKALMPGAVRKFNLMPKLGYNKADIKLIAETLYDVDFQDIRMKHKGNMTLNNGKKWAILAEDFNRIEKLNEQLKNFQSNQIDDYNNLGDAIFNTAKSVLLNEKYKGQVFKQLQRFFGNIEPNIHHLKEINSVDEGKITIKKLQQQFEQFDKNFQSQ